MTEETPDPNEERAGISVSWIEYDETHDWIDLHTLRDRDKAATRPQDWAPPARAHLFGLDTLTDDEHAAEMRRRAAYPDRYPRQERTR